MNLPPPPVDQGSGTVDVPLPPGTYLPVSIYAANRSAGQTVPAGNNSTTGLPNPTVEALYAAASFGALGLNEGIVNAFRTSDGASNIDDPPTVYRNYPLDPAADAGLLTLQGLQYKLRVIFPVPWQGNNSVTLSWRVKTTHYTGYQTGTDTPVESASQTYTEKSETFTPEVGDAYVETSVYTIEATDLTLGDTVTIVGSSSTATLAPGFAIALHTASGAKRGFLSYVLPESAPGVPVNPNPIYTHEAASTAATGAPAGTTYTGAQDASSTGYTDTNTFSANVPGKYLSAVNTSFPDNFGYDALSNIPQAVSIAPTVAAWPGGLMMTLGNPQDTSTITAPADATLAAINFATLFPDGVAVGGPGFLVALRDLPVHEQTYSVAKSVYSISLGLAIDTGVPSQFLDGTAPLANTGSLAFSWTREIIDLDTGRRTSSTLHTSVDFTGVPSLDLIAFSGLPADMTPAAGFLSPYYTEDVPGTNQRVEVSGLTVTTATLDCLASGPQAQVVAA